MKRHHIISMHYTTCSAACLHKSLLNIITRYIHVNLHFSKILPIIQMPYSVPHSYSSVALFTISFPSSLRNHSPGSFIKYLSQSAVSVIGLILQTFNLNSKLGKRFAMVHGSSFAVTIPVMRITNQRNKQDITNIVEKKKDNNLSGIKLQELSYFPTEQRQQQYLKFKYSKVQF